MSALVLAGTRPGGDPFARELGVAHKALIELAGKSLLQRVVEALYAAGIERVLVSTGEGPVAVLARELGAETIAPRAGPSGSVAAAFEHLGAPMVVTTSDHALLRPEWICELIDKTPENADLSVMLAERGVVEKAMPETRRTYLRFADGHWSGCNLFYLQTPTARSAIDTWSMVEADRKRPWRIAARLGPGTLFSMLLGRLTMAQGLSRLGKRIGIDAALVPASDGLAAVDVDKAADLEAVRALVGAAQEKASSPKL
ncbi:nucleotidyltransferase family protein [Qipengyuania sp. 1NDH17]|uniref:Nucleotidyltransferase family protein n=1 Tax=Qipengyuania polymorpha TaxID=2867234 RepID=A0ABS7IVL0_9SPHN|nr:nucleotidyltransferase family protein [Qipengyuania polymorpha]